MFEDILFIAPERINRNSAKQKHFFFEFVASKFGSVTNFSYFCDQNQLQ